MNEEEFLKALFGEMDTAETDNEKAAKSAADYLYANYSHFILAGFPEERAFQLTCGLLKLIFIVSP